MLMQFHLQIIPGTCKDKTTITLVAEDLDLTSGYDAGEASITNCDRQCFLATFEILYMQDPLENASGTSFPQPRREKFVFTKIIRFSH